MHVTSTLNRQPTVCTTALAHTDKTRSVRSTAWEDPIGSARRSFSKRIQTQFLRGSLSAQGRELADAARSLEKALPPGVQVATFAVNGVQSNSIVLIKRVLANEAGPNFLLYIPQQVGPSFHEFNTREAMTAWVKEQARDPAKLEKFSAYFAASAAPGQAQRVKEKLVQFANNDGDVRVGGYGYERSDIFKRLHATTTFAPKQVNGLTRIALYHLAANGTATYKGFRPDGKEVLYQYDQHGNLLGGNRFDYYFVRNSLNNNDPVVPTSSKVWAGKVMGAALDNVGANDLNGMYHELIRQLRNPGEGLATALKVFGLPPGAAHTVENIMKNPIKGTLLELNHNNLFGKYFGYDKETMDDKLEYIGDELQGHTPSYGTIRALSSALADVLEVHGPAELDMESTVSAR